LGSWIIGFEIGQQDLDLCLFCKEMMIWGQQHGKTGQNNFMKKITKKLCHGSHMLIKKIKKDRNITRSFQTYLYLPTTI
jgi:hypothetical protein